MLQVLSLKSYGACTYSRFQRSGLLLRNLSYTTIIWTYGEWKGFVRVVAWLEFANRKPAAIDREYSGVKCHHNCSV